MSIDTVDASGPTRAGPALLSRNPLIVRLASLGVEAPAELAEAVGGGSTSLYPGGTVIAETGPLLILEGWVAVGHVVPARERAVVRVAVPGDILRGPRCAFGSDTAELRACSRVVVADARALVRVGEANGAFGALERVERLEMLRYSVRVASLSATEKMASFIAELVIRLARVGLVNKGTISFPLTQSTIAGHVGLSVVHVNRVLQALRKQEIIGLSSGKLRVLDPLRLRDAAPV